MMLAAISPRNSSSFSSLISENGLSPTLSNITDQLQCELVPNEVISKYEVETVNEPIETVIRRRLADEARDKEEAFYFVDLGTIVKKYLQWVRYLPKVKPYYAVKCNPNPAIVRTLANLGVNFDCASKAEIQQVLGSGVSASRIIYANPTKMRSHISFAKTSGVEHMTFDNADELQKIHECYPDAKLLLRIITDDSQSICRFSTKFGAPLQQTGRLLALARQLDLIVVGVSFHVGSGCMSTASFVTAIQSALRVFKEAEEVGYKLSLLDLGGGWPGTDDHGTHPYGDHPPSISFVEIADAIRPLLDQAFGTNDDVQIIAEPGRFFVAESHTLMVNVFAKRVVEANVSGTTTSPSSENSHQVKNFSRQFLYYVNDGVYQSFNCIFFDHISPTPLVFDVGDRRTLYKCTIFGPTCDSMDCIAKDIWLPELEVGEWLYFKNMGAYTVAAASPFNGFSSCPTTYYIQSPITIPKP